MSDRKGKKDVAQPEASATLPSFSRAAQFRAESYREDDNTIEIVWSTGAPVRRFDWRTDTYYEEVLDMSPGAIRLERLNGGAPFLDSHNSWSTRSVIGSIVRGSAKVEGGRGTARVHLSTAESAADTVQKIRDGDVSNVSVGYIIHRLQKTSPTVEGGLAEWRAIDWEPYEVSAVPIPADAGAQIRSAPKEDEKTFPCVIIDNRQSAVAEQESTMTEEERAALAAKEAAERAAEAAPADPAPVTEARAAAPAAPGADLAAAQRAADEAAERAVRAERVRTSTILEKAESLGVRAFGEQHVKEGTNLEDFHRHLVDHIAAEQARNQSKDGMTQIAPTPRSSGEDVLRRNSAMSDALLHRVDPSRELSADARDFRGLSMVEMARELLASSGVHTRGMTKMEVVQRALEQRGGLHTTSDFAVILSNVANVTLRASYEAAPQSFRPLVKVVSVSDFKQVTRAQLGEAPSFDKVNEHGEFTRGSIKDAGEKYSVATYGKVVGVTRQVIINDDLGALTRLPQAFGVQAAQLESDLVWAELLGNPKMSDNIDLFHASHKNLGSAGAIAVGTVGKGRLAISQQTGLDGKTVLNLSPTFLIVPGELVVTAEQFLGQIYAAKTGDAVPDSLKKLQLLTDPRLDLGIARAGVAGSASNWYMAASPSQIDTIELAYLEGHQGVHTETRQGFDVDGVELKVRLDVGAKVIDHRGFWKNPYGGG